MVHCVANSSFWDSVLSQQSGLANTVEEFNDYDPHINGSHFSIHLNHAESYDTWSAVEAVDPFVSDAGWIVLHHTFLNDVAFFFETHFIDN